MKNTSKVLRKLRSEHGKSTADRRWFRQVTKKRKRYRVRLEPPEFMGVDNLDHFF